MDNYQLFIGALFLTWIIVSVRLMLTIRKTKDIHSVNPYLYDSIPSVFTTLGVLGTFLGIYIGLIDFDVNNINESIPLLLEGLKTAFLTSIIGIVFSIGFGKASKLIYGKIESNQPPKPSDEISALNEILIAIKMGHDKNQSVFKSLQAAINGEGDESLATHLTKIRNQNSDLLKETESQKTAFDKIQKSLGGDGETSLLTQLQKLRSEQNEYSQANKKSIEWIIESMGKNNKVIEEKFNEFAVLLAKNNTEALVDVMKKATEEFNNQMSALINKLVQENFAELNNSVKMLNQWQMENKEMIAKLTDQFKGVSNDFSISSNALKEVALNTSTLTDKNSQLAQIVDSLKKVMVDDKKFSEITTKIADTVETLKTNTEAFDATTQQLNQWVKKQRDFSDSVAKLLVKLEEVEKIKDINEVFWKNLKSQLNDGVSIIEKSIKDLDNEVQEIHGHFYTKLNDTFQNLDNLIQRVMAQYR
ncbi:MotA/TolQ/ExbB proton channel family protein [Mongoliitalea daihaiensis]|uniref:MotA/TolQ/ExbB proton channel family protein n=1 Tax=Mongoliitalea daihaiensis TaxID=2782006 RepID=UPI001F3F040A|nr:MotA/TolQ/ExbB proton channel family protein [Mongoliitalea daihaiensis]UJP65136.1 MotA/TolQ/ExbB proton channel family protein [Mongoliitalea daihaiensis]